MIMDLKEYLKKTKKYGGSQGMTSKNSNTHKEPCTFSDMAK
jgi:hypothetical protein